MIRGFDASSVQGNLDFGSVPDLKFVLLKAQQGNDGFDPFFERNMRAALAAGVEPFAYCFSYPLHANQHGDGRDPLEQAKRFVDRVHTFPEMVGRPIFLDLEWPAPIDWPKWACTPTSIAEWCKAHCAEVARLSGAMPVLYTYPDWWRHVSVGGDVAWAADYALWLASYTTGGKWPVEGVSPKLLAPWDRWLFWQFDGDGGLRLPNGIDADFCVFNGTADDLRSFATPTLPAPDVEPPLPDAAIVHPQLDFGDTLPTDRDPDA